MVEGIILPYGDSLGVPDDQPLGVGGGGIVEGSEVGGEEGDQEEEGEGCGHMRQLVTVWPGGIYNLREIITMRSVIDLYYLLDSMIAPHIKPH